MGKVVNFDELARLYEAARSQPAGSKKWLEFVSVVMESFPDIYMTARQMNGEMEDLRRQIASMEAGNE